MTKQELTEFQEFVKSLNETETTMQIRFYFHMLNELSFFSYRRRKKIRVMLNELNYHLSYLRKTRQARLAQRLKEIYNICD